MIRLDTEIQILHFLYGGLYIGYSEKMSTSLEDKRPRNQLY